ncbi:hypothetical protein C8J57DRAFT_86151 [Mycena rebaudengoi]|nr:hypothetical protein C8J57DRAFT_86151 [Mycena rebaudengoi]
MSGWSWPPWCILSVHFDMVLDFTVYDTPFTSTGLGASPPGLCTLHITTSSPHHAHRGLFDLQVSARSSSRYPSLFCAPYWLLSIVNVRFFVVVRHQRFARVFHLPARGPDCFGSVQTPCSYFLSSRRIPYLVLLQTAEDTLSPILWFSGPKSGQ